MNYGPKLSLCSPGWDQVYIFMGAPSTGHNTQNSSLKSHDLPSRSLNTPHPQNTIKQAKLTPPDFLPAPAFLRDLRGGKNCRAEPDADRAVSDHLPIKADVKANASRMEDRVCNQFDTLVGLNELYRNTAYLVPYIKMVAFRFWHCCAECIFYPPVYCLLICCWSPRGDR